MARVRSFALALVVALVLLPQLAAAPAGLAQDASPVAGESVWVGTEPDLAAMPITPPLTARCEPTSCSRWYRVNASVTRSSTPDR